MRVISEIYKNVAFQINRHYKAESCASRFVMFDENHSVRHIRCNNHELLNMKLGFIVMQKYTQKSGLQKENKLRKSKNCQTSNHACYLE